MAKKFSITVIEGPEKGLTETFQEGSFAIGRGKGDLILTDKKVSSKHCRIFVENDQLYVEDTGSTNGTFVGGRKVTEKTQLENLDQVIVGLSKLSIAIVDELKDFKEQNKSITGPFDLDDISGDDDPILESILEDSESSVYTETKTAKNSPKRKEPTKTVKASEASVAKMVEKQADAKEPEVPLPQADAVYRETGIHRIDNLIKDELETFSKWDHPSVAKSSEKVGAVPRVKVVLNPRRGPEGIGKIECSEGVTSFGRKDVDVRLNDLDVSRKHASVEIVGGKKAFVRDLASTNGTYINGKKISYQELNSGDLLQIGQTIFEVTVEGVE